MTQGLDPSDVVNVNINLSPTAVVGRNFGAMLVVGSSPVIDVQQRMRQYANLAGVASDFGIYAAEYQAAALWFSQSPQPNLLYIGRWAQTATSGLLRGQVLPPAFNIGVFQSVSNGAFLISVDGAAPKTIAGLNFTAAVALTGVAGIISAALGAANAGATCAWNGTAFVFTSDSGGPQSSVAPLQPPPAASAATDATQLLLAGPGYGVGVPGIAAEAPLACLQALCAQTTGFYGVAFGPQLTTAQHLLNAAYIEGSSPARLYFVTVIDPAVLDPTQTGDLPSQLAADGYSRTFVQYSSGSAYAAVSSAAREFAVDFTGSNTVITLKFKQDPGVAAEVLTETQAAALRAKNVNAFVAYGNGASIVQEGVVANGRFLDEVHCLDALANDAQTDVFNLLYQTPTKVPQTDAGVTSIVTQVESTLFRYVTNGFLAPGTWTEDGPGPLLRGQFLPKGFFVYAPPVAAQSQGQREARQSPLIQAAAKGSGAIHFASVQISFSR